MIKLVACDLDGTLLDENHQLSQRNIQAIQRLHKAGINFMVATGRNYQSVAPMFKKEGIHCDCLLLNGALITDAYGKRLSHTPLTPGIAEAALRILEESTLPYHMYTDEGIVSSTPKQGRAMFIRHMRKQGMRDKEIHELMETSSFGRYDREIDDPFQYLMEEPIIYKLEAFGDDAQQLQSVRMQLSGMKQTSVTNSVADNIEITASDAQKGLALKKLCAKQGLHPDEVMVFGDSLNDLSMLREFRYSFAMANAEDIIKEAAGYQTLSNAAHGVAHVLEQLLEAATEKRVSNL